MSDNEGKALAGLMGNAFFNEQDPFDTAMLVYAMMIDAAGEITVDVSKMPTILECFNQMKLVSEADPATFTVKFKLQPRLVTS